MHMATKTRPWTRADLARLPDDGNRYEVLDGELLVTPQANPPHQWIATELASALRDYCTRHSLGVVVGQGAVVFGKNELQPDVEVIPCAPGELARRWDDVPTPILVVEILSEGSTRHDRVTKRDAYRDRGIPVYWIVDPEERTVRVVRPDRADEVVADVLRWQPVSALEPLEIELSAILR
jgi:Uma2 family endonuclease